MKLIFDGNEWNVEDSTKNIVDIAKEHGIYIPAPCYFGKAESRCCGGCLILVNGKEAHACETLPADGMEIVYNSNELIDKREHNLTNYALGITPEMEAEACGSHGSCGDDCNCGSSCGDGCDCGGNCGCGSH